MVRFSHNDYVDLERYAEILAREGFIYIDKAKMSVLNDEMSDRALTCAILAVDRMMQVSSAERIVLSKDAIFSYLVEYEHCPESYFFLKKRESISLDQAKVLSKLYQKGYAEEFLDYYMRSQSLKAKISKVDKILKRCPLTDIETKDGAKLAKVPFTVGIQTNSRFNYNNFDIISQLCKEVCNSVTVEDEYCLVWGDFAQSDFRAAYNMFLRSPANDKLMSEYEDKYEALARMVARERGEDFNLDSFKEDRALYKKLTLATVYGKRTSPIAKENAFIQMMTAFLNKSPKYVEFYNRIERRVKLGLPLTVTSYFGNDEVCPNYAHDLDSTRDRALNSPVQKATSELVILAVTRILDDFKNVGCSSDDISLYYTRHDEPIFKIKVDKLQEFSWIFKQFETILVDDWTPLKLEFAAGYYYGEVDSELMEKMNISANLNQHKITRAVSVSKTEENFDYFPIKDVLVLHAHYLKIGGKLILALYAPLRNEVLYSLLDEEYEDKLFIHISQRLEDCEDKIRDAGYDDVLILNSWGDSDMYGDEMYFRFSFNDTSELSQVRLLARFMTCRFCKKEGIENTEILPPVQSDAVFVQSVEHLKILEV